MSQTSQTDDVSAPLTVLPYCRFRVLQLVAVQLQAIWADAVANTLEYIRHAVKRRHHGNITAGIKDLLRLASEVLEDTKGGRDSNAGLLDGCATFANAVEPQASVATRRVITTAAAGRQRSRNSHSQAASIAEARLLQPRRRHRPG